MSALRQINTKEAIPEEDVESQPLVTDGGNTSPKVVASAFASASTSGSIPITPSASSGGIYNPVFLARVVLQKVLGLLVTADEDDLTQPGGVVTLLKDIVLGVILGVLTISTLIFLDHRNVIHFQSAHNFRNAAFQLLNDPETIANLEESSDLKFMTISDYESKMKEINGVAEKLKGHEEVLEKRTKDQEEKKKELDVVKAEYDALYASPLLGIDKYCAGCSWRGKLSCEGRANYLINTYNTRPIMARINTMLHESCVKQT